MKSYNLSTEEGRHKFYCSKVWRDFRAHQLKLNPLCIVCKKKNILTPSTDCDHRLPLGIYPELALDPDNIDCLCRRCHSHKTWLETLGIKYAKPVTKPVWQLPTNTSKIILKDIK